MLLHEAMIAVFRFVFGRRFSILFSLMRLCKLGIKDAGILDVSSIPLELRYPLN